MWLSEIFLKYKRKMLMFLMSWCWGRLHFYLDALAVYWVIRVLLESGTTEIWHVLHRMCVEAVPDLASFSWKYTNEKRKNVLKTLKKWSYYLCEKDKAMWLRHCGAMSQGRGLINIFLVFNNVLYDKNIYKKFLRNIFIIFNSIFFFSRPVKVDWKTLVITASHSCQTYDFSRRN